MKADRVVFVGHRRLHLCRHAVERYQERVRPALGLAQVLSELDRVLRHATVTRERPEWATGSNAATEWVVLTDSICFPVVGADLVTCLTRGEFGSKVRVVRQEDRREFAARKGRPGYRKKHGKVARQERRRAQDERDAAA